MPTKRKNLLPQIGLLTGLLFFVVLFQFIHGVSLIGLGLRFDNFWAAVKLLTPFAVILGLVFIVAGLWRKTAVISHHFLITFFFYPLWALAQQYLILGFFFQKFRTLFGANILNICLCAVIFSLLHYPEKLLMLVTFIGAIIWIWAFIQIPNLFALSFFHGWLGAMFYYFVLGEGSLEKLLKK